MIKVKQIEIKNRTYYFDKDIINIQEFNSTLLKIDKKSDKEMNILIVTPLSAAPLNAIALKKKMVVNIQFLILQMKRNKY